MDIDSPIGRYCTSVHRDDSFCSVCRICLYIYTLLATYLWEKAFRLFQFDERIDCYLISALGFRRLTIHSSRFHFFLQFGVHFE